MTTREGALPTPQSSYQLAVTDPLHGMPRRGSRHSGHAGSQLTSNRETVNNFFWKKKLQEAALCGGRFPPWNRQEVNGVPQLSEKKHSAGNTVAVRTDV